jgi:hypothetical protein
MGWEKAYTNSYSFLAGRDMALQDVQVGAADGGVFDLDDGVGGFLDFGLGFVFKDDLVEAAVDEGFHGEWLGWVAG